MDWNWIPQLETAILGPGKRPGESLEIVAGAALLSRPTDAELRAHLATRLIERLGQLSAQSSWVGLGTFYRLSVTERVILMLLHRAKWSYAEVGKLLGISDTQLEELAWLTRLELVRRAGSPTVALSGPPRLSLSCPEYIPARPWTQRWVDGLYSGAEKLFLQQHLEKCAGCRETALRARKVFYAVEAELPSLQFNATRAQILEAAFRKTRYLENPQEQQLSEAVYEATLEVVRKPVFWVVTGATLLIALLS
jgi:hypothetical protein